MITIWATPPWANGGSGPNVAPTRSADLTDFGRAIADRYSGRHRRLPVRRPLLDLERAEPRDLPCPAVRPEGSDRQPACLRRRSTGPATRESRRPIRLLSWRSARRRIRGVITPSPGGPRRFRGTRHVRTTSRAGAGAARSTPMRPTPTRRDRALRRRRRFAGRTSRCRSCRDSRRRSTAGSGGGTSRSGSPSTATRRSRATHSASPKPSRLGTSRRR